MILLQETVTHMHPIWTNVFFYLFIASTLIFFGVCFSFIRTLRKRTSELKLIQQQHVARVDIVRKEHSEALEKLRIEMLKREEERSRQWMESEKETLHVLNGVSTLLDLSEKIGRVESEKRFPSPPPHRWRPAAGPRTGQRRHPGYGGPDGRVLQIAALGPNHRPAGERTPQGPGIGRYHPGVVWGSLICK